MHWPVFPIKCFSRSDALTLNTLCGITLSFSHQIPQPTSPAHTTVVKVSTYRTPASAPSLLSPSPPRRVNPSPQPHHSPGTSCAAPLDSFPLFSLRHHERSPGQTSLNRVTHAKCSEVLFRQRDHRTSHTPRMRGRIDPRTGRERVSPLLGRIGLWGLWVRGIGPRVADPEGPLEREEERPGLGRRGSHRSGSGTERG